MTRWQALTLLMLWVRGGMATFWALAGGPVGVCLAASEAVSLVLGVLNWRRAVERDAGAGGLVVVACYIASMLFVPESGGSAWATAGAVVGVVLIVWARLLLGVSYSVGPSSWVGGVYGGPYAVVRHPQLVLSLLIRGWALIAWPSLWNAGALVVFAGLVVGVVLAEERFLVRFREWRSYAERVRWRLMPGVW